MTPFSSLWQTRKFFPEIATKRINPNTFCRDMLFVTRNKTVPFGLPDLNPVGRFVTGTFKPV